MVIEAGKRVVITGGTRGLGKELAKHFLSRGCRVFITGSRSETLDAALRELGTGLPPGRIGGMAADARNPEDAERTARRAEAFLGGADHWILNAGVNHAARPLWELEPAELDEVFGIDLLGPLYQVRAAWPILAQSGGYIWFMEGHGSDGRIMKNLSGYGTAKRAVAYAWRALAVEAEGSGVRVGGLSPGIMATDFILKPRKETRTREEIAKADRILDILADRPETVAAWMAPRILSARKSGLRLAWLTGGKIALRFLAAPFGRRGVIPPR